MIRIGTKLNITAGENKFCLPPVKMDQLSKNITINNTRFSHTTMETVIGVIILKAILFTLLPNMLELLPINGHSVKKSSREITFHLTKSKKKIAKSVVTSSHLV
jgi:hypothetical protein